MNKEFRNASFQGDLALMQRMLADGDVRITMLAPVAALPFRMRWGA
jgi:hypothetical protein